MQDSRLRLEKLYTCKVRSIEERRLNHAVGDSATSTTLTEGTLSTGDAISSNRLKNSMNTMDQICAWKEQFPAVRSGFTSDSSQCFAVADPLRSCVAKPSTWYRIIVRCIQLASTS